MGYRDITFAKNSVFLVGGGAGFIGSNLCEALVEMGYTVRCLDNLSTGKYENIAPLIEKENFTFIKGDIRELDTCLEASEGADYVMNQAAWGSVPRSIEMPLLYEEINIRGTLNMMEAARQNGVKKFVYASSSSVYGDHPVLPKKEGQEGKVLSPYALTKKWMKNTDGSTRSYMDWILTAFGILMYSDAVRTRKACMRRSSLNLSNS